MHASNPVSLLDELARCFKTFELLSGRQIRALGLTPPQFEVITALGESGDMHCAALGEITLISKGTLTGVLDRLQQKGWITREPAPADRRSILVRLTPQGQSLYSQLATMPHVHFQSTLDTLGPDFTQNLSTQLRQLRHALERHENKPAKRRSNAAEIQPSHT